MLCSWTVISLSSLKRVWHAITKPSANPKGEPDRFLDIGSEGHFLFAFLPLFRIADRTLAAEQCGRSVRVLAPKTWQLRDGARAAPSRHGGRQGRGHDGRVSGRQPVDLVYAEGVPAGPVAVPDGVRDGRQARQALDGFDPEWHRCTSLQLCVYGGRREKRGGE